MDSKIFWWIIALLVVAGLIGLFIRYFNDRPASVSFSERQYDSRTLIPGAAQD